MRLAEEGAPASLSPDGRCALVQAATYSFEVAKWPGLRVVPTGAGEVRTIPTTGLQLGNAAWSADGKWILVWAREADRGGRVFVFKEDGTRRAVTPEGVTNCVVGRQRLACIGPTSWVAFYPLEGGEPHYGPELEATVSLLRLSEDETSLFVSTPRATRTAPLRVERVDLATGRRTPIHEIKPGDMAGVWLPYDPLVTPDGRGYAYTYYQFLHNLYLADGLR